MKRFMVRIIFDAILITTVVVILVREILRTYF